jgi:hypothetical protein
MLNPSLGNGTGNDPTITRCLNKAQFHKFGALEIVNLYSFIASKPPALWRAFREGVQIVHPENDTYVINTCRGRMVAFAMGVNAEKRRVLAVLTVLTQMGIVPKCFGHSRSNKFRYPLHPLAICDTASLSTFQPDATSPPQGGLLSYCHTANLLP